MTDDHKNSETMGTGAKRRPPQANDPRMIAFVQALARRAAERDYKHILLKKQTKDNPADRSDP